MKRQGRRKVATKREVKTTTDEQQRATKQLATIKSKAIADAHDTTIEHHALLMLKRTVLAKSWP
jgi:hypothetical protein